MDLSCCILKVGQSLGKKRGRRRAFQVGKCCQQRQEGRLWGPRKEKSPGMRWQCRLATDSIGLEQHVRIWDALCRQ